jgi:hypothetical protein
MRAELPEPKASTAERFLLGLHATVPAALLAIALVQLFPPPQLAAQSQRPLWVVWSLIGLWLGLSLLAAALLRRRLLLWRAALATSTLLLLAAAWAGLALHTAQAMTFALALVALGAACAACAALAPAIGPRRLREQHRRAHAKAPARHPSRPLWRRLLAGFPFWAAGGLLIEAFRLAHVVAREPQRGAGMVGMLLAFFLLLPAATLAPWLRRTAVMLAVVAAAAYAWLALRSQLMQWWIAMALSLVVALQALLRGPGRGNGL